MLENLKCFLGTVIIIANCQCVLTQQCVDDLNKFQRDSHLARHFVRMYCHERNCDRTLTNFGVILSKDAVLTSQQVKSGERWTCYVKYGDLEGSISRTGNVPNMIKSRGIQTYKRGPFQSAAFTPLAYILLEEEIELNITSAWPIPYTYYSNESKCVVVGGDKLDRSSKIVEREVELLKREDCESAYPNLDKNNVCITIPKEFCNFKHCDYYSHSAALVCGGVFFALVGEHTSAACNSGEPRTCAGINEAQMWIRAVQETVNFNKDYQSATVMVGLQKPHEIFYGLGAIISRYKVLTAYVPFKSHTSEEGYVDYGYGRSSWRHAKPVTIPSIIHQKDLQLYVLALQEDIHLFPGGAQAVRLAKELPQQGDQCVVGTFKPRWMLLAVTIIDHNECRKTIKNLHEDHLCIRHNFPVTFDELEGGNPIICDGMLTAIATKCDCERNELHPATPIYTFLPWILTSINERGFSSSDQPRIILLLLLINSGVMYVNIFL
uniref:Peptidase S1 domain-containing protein n=1 Tax=Glossina morsitans morsitans TaxID=37546 RepID=A0A340TZS8_GLOMM